MSIDNLRSALPDYAKDLNLNLSSLTRIGSLSEQQLWGTILATAAATKVDSVVVEVAEEAKQHLSDEAYKAALGAATIMGMNNVLYRTRAQTCVCRSSASPVASRRLTSSSSHWQFLQSTVAPTAWQPTSAKFVKVA